MNPANPLMTVAGQITDEQIAEMLAAIARVPNGDWTAEGSEIISSQRYPIATVDQHSGHAEAVKAHLLNCHPITIAALLTELQHRREAEADDGMSCTCGGGSLVGHASGCPEAAASPSSPASGVRVKVKQLVWSAFNDDWHAYSIVGEYSVGKVGRQVSAVLRLIKEDQLDDVVLARCDSVDAAKAVAQSDFAGRVLSALGEHP